MRLSTTQTRLILDCVRAQFGADAQGRLFGSRLDDAARSGDVDLLVEAATERTVRQRALANTAPEQALSLPVDAVAQLRGAPGSAFAQVALAKAQLLGVAA